MDGLPTMSHGPQHLRALQRANHVRLARAELKRRIAEGELTARVNRLISPQPPLSRFAHAAVFLACALLVALPLVLLVTP